MKFQFTTMPKMRRVIRDRYRSEAGKRRLTAAKWLLENCNDTQLGNVFDLTLPADIAALKERLQNKVDKLAALEAAEAVAAAEGGE